MIPRRAPTTPSTFCTRLLSTRPTPTGRPSTTPPTMAASTATATWPRLTRCHRLASRCRPPFPCRACPTRAARRAGRRARPAAGGRAAGRMRCGWWRPSCPGASARRRRGPTRAACRRRRETRASPLARRSPSRPPRRGSSKGLGDGGGGDACGGGDVVRWCGEGRGGGGKHGTLDGMGSGGVEGLAGAQRQRRKQSGRGGAGRGPLCPPASSFF